MYKEKYIKCDCIGECTVLKVTEVPFYNTDNNKTDEYNIHMSMYVHRKSKFPLGHKLKLIWHIIRYGAPYDDQIVISKEDSIELSNFLNEIYLESKQYEEE